MYMWPGMNTDIPHLSSCRELKYFARDFVLGVFLNQRLNTSARTTSLFTTREHVTHLPGNDASLQQWMIYLLDVATHIYYSKGCEYSRIQYTTSASTKVYKYPPGL